MNERSKHEVEERRYEQALEELGGRVTPPDRVDDVLARVATGATRAAPDASARRAFGRGAAAALVLVGVAVTAIAAWLARDPDGAPRGGRDEAAVAIGDDGARDGAGDTAAGDAAAGDAAAANDGAAEELPKGTDPADLAAMRSAEAMLAAEEKLTKWVAEGRVAGVDRILRFDEITGWKYREGVEGMPDDVRALDGEKVLMLGFMLPLDEVSGMREFLLVESLWSCCYGQPPDVHGLVRCVLPDDQPMNYRFEPLKVVGKFRVGATLIDGYCVDVFQLEVEYAEIIE